MDRQISVIVPVFNDAQGLEDTVASLVRQSYPRGAYEVIVVDNGSTDGTAEAAERLAAQHPDVVRVAREAGIRGSYAARNEGVRRAAGRILCFIDADMRAPPDHLRRVEAELARGVDYLGCRVRIVAARPTLAARYNRAVGFPVREYLERHRFAPTCCLSVRREVVEAVGGFDARLESGGDLEFGQRVYAAGFRQAYAEHIVLEHPARSTYASLLSKQRRLARGAAQLAHYYPERYGRLARRYLTPRYYLPPRPAWLAARLAAAGVRVSWVQALGIALWTVPLSWVEPLVHVREARRLRSGGRGGAGVRAGAAG